MLYNTAHTNYKTMKKITLALAAALLSLGAYAQTITTIAGVGPGYGYSGDHGPATAAKLHTPLPTKVDVYGNVFFSDHDNNVIRKIDGAGVITTIAGNGTAGYSGDGAAATAAMLYGPNNLAFDKDGNLFFADEGNNVIREIDLSGVITTVAGTNVPGYNGDNIPATAAMLSEPTAVAFDSSWNMYIADVANGRVRMVNSSGIITTIAGVGTFGFSGDGGPATAAMIDGIITMSFNAAGEMIAVDQSNYRIRKISGGIITTIAGNGDAAYSMDGVPATATGMFPSTTTFDKAGNLWICDAYNNRVRMVNSAGIISTVVGTGAAGYSGDGGPATAAELSTPSGVTFDICGNFYISDQANNVIRKVIYFTGMPAITGAPVVNVGAMDTLSIAQMDGTWSSSSSTIATVGGSGIVMGLAAGIDTITYTNMCGSQTFVVTVHSSTGIENRSNETVFSIVPNPSSGEITVSATLAGTNNSAATLDILDMTGRKVYTDFLPINNGSINSHITLDGSIANGLYIIKVRANDVNKAIQFSLYR